MKTVGDALAKFDVDLKLVYDKNETDAIKYLAISEITKLSKTRLRAFPEMELTEAHAKKLTEALQQLQTGKPIQYILGETEFYGLPFKVTPAVLIPRPETEELVEWVLKEYQVESSRYQENVSILDIGTGSGCIPITLKKCLPEAKVSAIDISKDALNVAKQNAELNEVEVNFIEADILNPILISDSKYSIITSNPPYVTEREKSEMHTNVLSHEPHLALFVSDHEPLIFYNVIADFALQYLENNGLLFLEINENLGKQTVELLSDKGFINIELRQDMRGKDRMIEATINY